MIFLILSVVDTLEAIPLWTTEQLAKKEYQFSYVQDIEVYKGRIYIVDSKLNRVAVFDTTGEYIMDIGSVGQGPGEHIKPSKIAMVNDTIYVLDSGNRRLNIYSNNNEFIKSIQISGSDIAISSENIYIVKRYKNNLIAIFNKENEKIVKNFLEKQKLPKWVKGNRQICEATYNSGDICNINDTIFYFFNVLYLKGLFFKSFNGKIIDKCYLEDCPSFKLRYDYEEVVRKNRNKAEFKLMWRSVENGAFPKLFDNIRIKDGKIYIFTGYVEVFNLSGNHLHTFYSHIPFQICKFTVDDNQQLWGISDNLYKLERRKYENF